ncbi:MAG: hypothetical protein KDK97_06035 [Verrucomicrobiales bacterium]|nr:hypothetical protein [Verrucomicrobiales bacterium]MCP5556333.1 hypothetical protein [Verrucomicrobiaceae bacterium]
MKHRWISSLLLLALSSLTAFPAHAVELTVTKLHGRATTPQTGNFFGVHSAVSDLYILVGELYNDDAGPNAGAAHLYDARTGRYLRKLLPTPDPDNQEFGVGVALCGNLAVIRMTQSGTTVDGAVFGFDARTGKLLWKLTAPATDEQFGWAVAVSGKTLLVGAPFAAEGGHSSSGLAYVYDLSSPGTPVLIHTLGQGAAAANGDSFGASVALSGDLALVGSLLGTGAQLHDVRTGQLLRRWTGTGGFSRAVAMDAGRAVLGDDANDQIRVFDVVSGVEAASSPVATPGLQWVHCLSVSGNLALVGCALFTPPQGASAGAARLIDLSTGAELRVFTAPDGAAGDAFGFSTALCGSRAVIGADLDDDLGNQSGSAYFYRDVAGPLPLRTLAQTRDFAPGVVDADFRAFGDAVINGNGESAFLATLMGSGAGRGTAASGLWSDLTASHQLIARGGTELGGGHAPMMVNATSRPVFNRPDDMVFLGSIKGTGVTSANDAAILRSNAGGAPVDIVREGYTHPTADGAVFDRFLEVAQSHSGTNGDLAVTFRYKRGPGGVTASSDTGVMAMNHDGTIVGTVFEEDHFDLLSMPNTFWAQFAPRVSKTGSRMAWTAFLAFGSVTTANNQGLFSYLPGVGTENLVARKGDALPGGTISSILGEAINRDDQTAFRAALSNAPKSENEALVFAGNVVWNKGDLAANFDTMIPPGVRIVRLLKFWPIAGNKVIYLAKLGGPKVSGSNDCALFLWDQSGATEPQKTLTLLREGDYVAGCDCPKIGVIQRVDVEPTTGKYVVLTSLTGSSAANQALFTGNASAGNVADQQALRRPTLQLRKGNTHQIPTGTTTKILSLTFANTTDAAGAGAKGGPQVIDSSGRVTMCLQFTDKSKHLVTGKP